MNGWRICLSYTANEHHAVRCGMQNSIGRRSAYCVCYDGDRAGEVRPPKAA